MSKTKKKYIVLLLLFLTTFILVTYQQNRESFMLHRILSYPYNILNNFTTTISVTSKEIWNVFEENRRLKKELTAALLERQRYTEIIQENKRLKELLSLNQHEPNYVTTARVIARGYDKLLNTVVLDKGKNSGIRKDMAVITTRGLAGKIYSVKDNFSEVLLLQDPNFSVSVRLQDSRRQGVISGTGYKYCLLKYIPPEESVEKNDVVATSGLDGIFPSGIPVGIVSHINKKRGEFFQHIKVLPFQSDTKIEEVVIVSRQ